MQRVFRKYETNRNPLETNPNYRACLTRLFEMSPWFTIPDDQRDLYISEPDADVQAPFDTWIERQSPCVITTTGNKGVGKSLVARTLFRKLRNTPGLTAYFSFAETDVHRASAASFLSSVAFQVLIQDPPRFTRIGDLFSAIEASNAWAEAGLLTLFRSLSDTKTDLNLINLVIDGLHRCDASFRNLIEMIMASVRNTNAITTLKAAIFYQDRPDIQLFLEPDGLICVPGPTLSTDTPKPMATSLAARAIAERPYFAEMEPLIAKALEKCKYTTEMSLAIHSLDNINTDGAPRTLKSLELAVKNMRTNLPDVISSCYKNLPGWGRTALGWIAHCKRPLRSNELMTSVALTTSAANFTASFDPKQLPVDFAADIRSVFGPLVRIEDGGILFSDYIVRDRFLCLIAEEQEREPEASDKKPLQTQIPSNTNITAILFGYLSWSEFSGPVNAALTSGDEFVQPPGPLFHLLTYAVRFLPFHYQACENSSDPLELARAGELVRMWPRLNSWLNPTATPPDLCVADPLLLAAQLGLKGVVKGLGKKINLPYRQVVLNLASWGGYIDTVDVVIRGAAKGETLDCTIALEHASVRGHDAIVRHLIQYMKSTSTQDLNPVLEKLVCRAAELGYEDQVSLFLANGADANSAPDDTTPLQHAARNGHASLVRSLLTRSEADVDANSKAGTATDSPILLAAKRGYGQIVRYLLDARADVTCLTRDDTRRTPLHLASQHGHKEIVELLISADKQDDDPVIDHQCLLQNSALIIACKNGHDEVAMLLLDAKANVNLRDREGHSALYHALRPDNEAVAMAILGNASSAAEFEDIGDVLLRAAEMGLTDVVDSCLKCDTRVDNVPLAEYRDKSNHRTALHKAAQNGHRYIVDLLLRFTGNVDPRGTDDEAGFTPLALAAEAGEPEIMASLLAHGADPRLKMPENMTIVSGMAKRSQDSVRHGQAVTMLLEEGVDPNMTDNYQRTALHLAASGGNVEITRALLRHRGIDAQATGRYRWNALHYLARTNHKTSRKVAELLIKAGTDPLGLDIDDWLPIHLASKSGNILLMELLLEHNPESLEAKADDGRTAIHFAVAGKNTKTVKWLMDHSADGNVIDENGFSALMAAARYDRQDIIRVLMNAGCNAMLVGSTGRTALHHAAYHGSLSAGRQLVEANMSILSCMDKSNLSALHLAIKSWEAPFATMLLEDFYAKQGLGCSKGTDLGASLTDLSAVESNNGDTPLITAIKFNEWGIVAKLLQLGAATEHRNKQGLTALLAAVERVDEDDLDLYRLLLDPDMPNCADVNAGEGNHPTALHHAARYKKQFLVEDLIERQGAEVNRQGGQYGTALGAAAATGRSDIVTYLLSLPESNKADPNLPAGDFANALCAALWSKTYSLLDPLLAAGVDINGTDIQGRSAFHIAARRGAWDTLVKLREAEGAEIPVADKCGRTLLHFAAMSGQLNSFLRVLVDETLDWDIDVEDIDGWTPLHWACRQDDNLPIVDLLVQCGADVIKKTKDGWTVENIAISHNAKEVAKSIKESLSRISMPSLDGTPAEPGEKRRRRRWKVGQPHTGVECDGCLQYVSEMGIKGKVGLFASVLIRVFNSR